MSLRSVAARALGPGALLAALLVLAPPGASASPPPTSRWSWYVRGGGGVAAPSLASLNGFMGDVARQFVYESWSASAPAFRRLAEFGGETGVTLAHRYTFGVSVSREQGSLREPHARDYVDGGGHLQHEARTFDRDLAVTLVEALAAVHGTHALRGASVGLTLGLGYGRFVESITFEDSAKPGAGMLGGTFSTTSLVSGVFAGYDQGLPGGWELSGRAGYRLANLGPFTGKYRGDSSDVGYPPASEYDNLTVPPFNFDLSGAYARAALGWRWGS